LVGTTADFRRFGPPRSLPFNDLPGENSGTAGRIGEVRLIAAAPRDAAEIYFLQIDVHTGAPQLLGTGSCQVAEFADVGRADLNRMPR
jgi:hypothetical protein